MSENIERALLIAEQAGFRVVWSGDRSDGYVRLPLAGQNLAEMLGQVVDQARDQLLQEIKCGERA